MKLHEIFQGTPSRAVGNFNVSAPREIAPNFLRGGRPLNKEGVKELKSEGVETVICLLHTRKEYQDEIKNVSSEEKAVEELGMKFIHLEMDERQNPDEQTIKKFLDAVKGGGKVYTHCSAGQDRVGLLAAIYEVEILGKSYEEAYADYLKGGHNFYSYPNLDKFFYQYCAKFGKRDPESVVRSVVKSERSQNQLLADILG